MSMRRNMRFYPMILVLAVLLTFTGGWTSKVEGSALTDLGAASWAERAITEMEASGVVAGYPGDVYLPYNNVTKLEAVAMLVRMLGLEEQAKEAAEAGADYKMPPDLYWGEGYLIMAVQRGMLDGDYLYLLQPNDPATRTEVAMLAFHALKLEPDSGALEFDDADQISDEYREGVAAIVKSGIMKGLPGNVFKPNDEINRAQIAVMMSKIVELKYADPCPNRRANGIISDIDQDSRVITVRSTGSIFYADDCKVFLDGTSILPDGLRVGDKVEMIQDENLYAVFINAMRSGDAQKYRGSVSSLQKIGEEYWLGVTSEDGQELIRAASPDVAVNKAGNQVGLATLNTGDFTEIILLDNKIIEINFLGSNYSLKGEIKDLDTTGNYGITILNDDEETIDYKVSDDVEVERNGNDIDFDNLDIGDMVRLELNSEGVVELIKVLDESPEQVEGEIRDIDTIGTLGIAIRSAGGDTKEYGVVEDVEVERDGDSIDFDDLDEGEWVRLELNSRDSVNFIEVIEEYYVVEGTVNELIIDDSPKQIRIKKSNGTRTQYDIARDADYFRDGDSITLEDIVIGAEVEVQVNDRERIIKIDVVNDEDIVLEGTVIYVSESGNRIKIEQPSGSRFTFYFADDPVIEDEDGDTLDLEDIEEDSEVSIELEGGDVASLTVLD